jgi:hypothetical protein
MSSGNFAEVLLTKTAAISAAAAVAEVTGEAKVQLMKLVACQFNSRKRGTTIAEMPAALWLLILMAFPMIIVATSALRFGFFWNACRESAMQAAKCQTFLTSTSVGPSACSTADAMSAQAAGAFTGITIIPPVNVYIMSTNVNTSTTTKGATRTPLAAAADTANNIYDIQVEINGQVEPLIRVPFAGLQGAVPGITGPYPVVVRSQYTSEVPQGLNQ